MLRHLFTFSIITLITACVPDPDRGQDQGSQTHDVAHGLASHDHEPGALVYTHFTEQTELFVEFPVLVVGQESPFAAHLTRLSDFKPVNHGTVIAVLSGHDLPEARFEVSAPASPGIFRPVVIPRYAGKFLLSVRLDSPEISVIHDLGEVLVHEDMKAAAEAVPDDEHEQGAISFLKEQQWQVDFATALVKTRTLRSSIPATGTLRAAANAEAYVSAPTAGHLISYGDAFPSIGRTVQRGETLSMVAPRLGGETDIASLELAMQKARSNARLATLVRRRLEGLLAQEAIAERRVSEARSHERIARAELTTAERRLNQYQSVSKGEVSGVPVPAPIFGTVAQVDVAPGMYLREGQSMFRIVNLERLWLEARIAEADIGHARQATGAVFSVDGFEQDFEVRPGENGRLVLFGSVVDPTSRTLPLIYEFTNPDKALPIGMYARVRVLTGETRDSLAVPVSAVIDDNGQDVVFVQLGGESYERRVMGLGFRDGDYVQVRRGLSAGERIVTEGAYLVRLAAASPAEAGHGHAH